MEADSNNSPSGNTSSAKKAKKSSWPAFMQNMISNIPEPVKATWKMRTFGLLKVPMLAYLSPKVLLVEDQKIRVQIKLGYRSKNHLNSMYFGALAAGADLVVGLLAMHLIDQSPERVSLVFKDFNAEFLKRAEGDVTFCCDQGDAIRELVDSALNSEDRVEKEIDAYAIVPSKLADEPVAKFKLTLSLKKRAKKNS